MRSSHTWPAVAPGIKATEADCGTSVRFQIELEVGTPTRSCLVRATLLCPRRAKQSRHEISESLQIGALRLAARLESEQAGCGAAEDVVFCLFGKEGEVPDRARQVEIPVRIVGSVH